MEIYLVGGAVRDALLGLVVTDRDWVVVGGTAEGLIAQGFKPVGQDFPVFLHPETQEEYALARTERKSGQGYKGFVVSASPSTTLEEDLLRRDLTINAMAQSGTGDIIDPYGGQQDLKDRILRHVSPAFSEDPLRVLRVARFMARFHHLGFRVAPETCALMTQMTQQGDLNHLVPERVWQETYRALSEPSPWHYLNTLHQCGALKVLMPHWQQLYDAPMADNLTLRSHLEQVLALNTDPDQRYALICASQHWIKQPSDSQDHTWKTGHCDDLKVPKKIAELAQLCSRWIPTCHQIRTAPPQAILTLIQQADGLKSAHKIQAFLQCCAADFSARHHGSPYPQADWLMACVNRCRALQSNELMSQGYRGKALGEQLTLTRIQAITEEQQTWAEF